MKKDQAELHKLVKKFQAGLDDATYIANHFSYLETEIIRAFLEKERKVKELCEKNGFQYVGPNDKETDYKRRQRLKCRVRYHLKNASKK